MAIFIRTKNPKKLLEDLKKEINDKKIDTWQYDDDGDFYHVQNQWKFKGSSVKCIDRVKKILIFMQK